MPNGYKFQSRDWVDVYSGERNEYSLFANYSFNPATGLMFIPARIAKAAEIVAACFNPATGLMFIPACHVPYVVAGGIVSIPRLG